MPFTRGRALRDATHPVGRAPAARRPGRRRDPRRRARRPRARRHLGVGARRRRRPGRGRPARGARRRAPRPRPGRASRRSPTSRQRPGPCSTTSADRESVGGNLGLDPFGAAARLGTTPDLAPARRPGARVRPPRRLARHHRRRPRAARGRRHRRRRPRRGRRHRGRVPAPPRGGRHPGRRGVRADRPAGRRHRRPVPHRGRPARRPPGVGPGRRGLRRRRGPARSAHPCGDQPADVHPRGPVGQRAAQHPGRLRCLGRRGRRHHRAALRHRARPARAARPAAGPQHPDPARRRVQRRPGHRPRRRLVVPRVAHRPGRGCRVVPFPGGRAGRWCRAGPRRRAAARLGRARRAPSATGEIVTRRRPLTGVSMFPVSGTQPAARRARTAVAGW